VNRPRRHRVFPSFDAVFLPGNARGCVRATARFVIARSRWSLEFNGRAKNITDLDCE